MRILGLAAILAIAFLGSQGVQLDALIGRTHTTTPPLTQARYTSEQLCSDLQSAARKTRRSEGNPELCFSREIEERLSKCKAKADSQADVSALAQQLNQELPYYSNLNLEVVRTPTIDAALPLLLASKALKAKDADSIAVHIRPPAPDGSQTVLLAMAQMAPEFSPDAINKGTHTLLTMHCPNCDSISRLKRITSNGPFSLSCSRCSKTFASLVTDNLGDSHYINDFLIGFQPPAHFAKGISKIEEIRQIWRGVWTSCSYSSDAREGNATTRDAWQTGPETLRRGLGDCDDSAVLLTDWLITRGFEARLALGKMNGQGHAWVVVRLDGRTYLLESTSEPPSTTSEMPLVSASYDAYTPEQLVDPSAFYCQADANVKFDGDYFSSYWERHPQGDIETKPSIPKGYALHPSQLALGCSDWQLTWPTLSR